MTRKSEIVQDADGLERCRDSKKARSDVEWIRRQGCCRRRGQLSNGSELRRNNSRHVMWNLTEESVYSLWEVSGEFGERHAFWPGSLSLLCMGRGYLAGMKWQSMHRFLAASRWTNHIDDKMSTFQRLLSVKWGYWHPNIIDHSVVTMCLENACDLIVQIVA